MLGLFGPPAARRARSHAVALAGRSSARAPRLAAVYRPTGVFHDAYQDFDQRYGLNAVGSITVSPERQPGARRLQALRRKIGTLQAVCVFAEPQFEPTLMQTVVAGTKAKTGVLDYL